MNNDVISYLVKLVGEGKISNLSIESLPRTYIEGDKVYGIKHSTTTVSFDLNRIEEEAV